MSRLHLANLIAVLAALALAMAAVGLAGKPGVAASASLARSVSGVPVVTLPDGRRAVRDARGTPIPIGHYRRIVSLGLESDALVAALCEPERIAAISSYGHGPDLYHLGGKPRLEGLTDLEAIIVLKPDLVLTSNYGDQLDRVTRLRDAGLTVCDLSSQCGLQTLLPNARLIATMLDVPERGERLARSLERRMRAVAAGLPADLPRRRGMYLGVFGGEIYGGTVGSSYHDVLTAAGLVDCAAAQHRGWPKFSIEELIVLAPEVIVMKRGTADALRQLPGASAVAALQRADGVIEIDGDLLEDPGPVMLEAAEALFVAAYPSYAAR